ncbi:hypothetical protein [Halomonas elongata]|uniref:Uncharacterized protein n=2 Tax=Halomonas elongata TaxID=2746 RepID=A0A1B8P039_HALEL|nr:hypothetical protein [Halomonas elongata]MBW5801857.1 hypothetical protein [Halomonas elongata]MDL4861450.1 hypothetical protein [Halomonas elongata]OBX35609.1 hypothetical protein A8U91_04683 [Halomonas elongata]RAW08122.1 hypothetical protein DKQ62_05465 [Halomonas elongata]WBF17867.1 hypothetical protein LM502_17645 [Halomonas elongata]
MRTILKTLSLSMLVLTVLLPSLYLFDVLGEIAMKWALLLVTLVWFAVTPLWMGRRQPASQRGHRGS